MKLYVCLLLVAFAASAASLRCNSCTYIADAKSDDKDLQELFDDMTSSRYNDEKCGDASDLDDSYCWSRLYQCSTAKVSMKISTNDGATGTIGTYIRRGCFDDEVEAGCHDSADYKKKFENIVQVRTGIYGWWSNIDVDSINGQVCVCDDDNCNDKTV